MSTKVHKIDSWSSLKDAVRNYPIEKAAYIREGQLELRKLGYQLFGICPFHTDERVGNFALGGPHNGFKCFACGKSGDLIDLVMRIDGVGFKKSLTIAAVDLDIMTREEADKFTSDGKPAYYKELIDRETEASNPYIELDEQQIKWRDAVYTLLSQGDSIVNPVAEEFGLEGGERLSNKHYYQLREERGLTDEQITEAGFFTMKRDYQWLHILYYRLFEEYGLPPNALNVPGFFRLKEGLELSTLRRPDGTIIDFELMGYGKQDYWFMRANDALGIPIRDTDGRITAIQLRPDGEGTGGKYIWFSSTYATGKKNMIDGLSAGAQHDISIPNEWNTPHVFITEGKFKSLAINKVFRSTSISLQGVNTYNGINDKIENIKKNHTKDVENIIVAFDSDLSFNDAVMNAVVDMVNKELTDYNVYIAVWDHLYGKGIDDFIDAGNLTKDSIVRIKPEVFIELKEELNKRYPLSNDADAEEKRENRAKREERFYEWLKEEHPHMKLHPSRFV